MTTILGIDPGTLVTGYGILKKNGRGQFCALDYGSISPPKKLLLTERYRIIYEGVCLLMDKFQVEALAIETQFIDKNPQSGIKLGMARGIVILAATLRKIPVFEYAPTRAKKAVMGRGRASKHQVQGMIKTLLGLTTIPEPEDAADALALAFCHGHTLILGNGEEFKI